MKFELLNTKQHNRQQFDCGVNVLNIYLQRFANQDQKRNLTRIYVLAEETRIIGYYSISAHSVLTNELPDGKRLAHYPYAPFLLLGRLAIDNDFKGQGFGDALLFHAFKTTLDMAEKIGILGMVVDAKDETATRFYEKFGFKRLIASPNRLVLPLSALAPLL
ncbi:GNAT family N-acetyltransferase [Methyloprofundus sp.]|uniref:GNAT family N-acetyltransferase n=1 Tax=Methyloprofundus sp. TaxID=2020875 RepID=UPI003D116098